MKLITKEIERRLEKHPLYSTGGLGFDSEVIVKFFAPVSAATWLVTEAQRTEDGDWLFFGYHCLHLGEWEWGYVTLSDLQSVRLPFGLSVERDMHISKHATVRELAR